MPVLIFRSLVLNEIWIIDLFSALVSMLMSSSKLFLFLNEAHSKIRCETVIGIVLCYSHQVCCLLYYLCEINNGIHMYHFTFELCTSVSGCGCGFRFERILMD